MNRLVMSLVAGGRHPSTNQPINNQFKKSIQSNMNTTNQSKSQKAMALADLQRWLASQPEKSLPLTSTTPFVYLPSTNDHTTDQPSTNNHTTDLSSTNYHPTATFTPLTTRLLSSLTHLIHPPRFLKYIHWSGRTGTLRS